jgi:hypothetical protein
VANRLYQLKKQTCVNTQDFSESCCQPCGVWRSQTRVLPGGWHNYCGNPRRESDFPEDLPTREIHWGNKNGQLEAAYALDRMSQSWAFIRERF